MKTLALYKTLRHHRKLAEKRSLDFGQNKVAKVLACIGTAFALLYLASFAVMFSLIANDVDDMTATELMCSVAPFILAVDFFFRFTMQQTPSQIIKPYILLPMPRYACINCFVASSLLTIGNLTWFSMLLPYTIMSVVFSHGLLTSAMLLLFFWIAILANSQWYSIVRTLLNDSMLYWLLPAIVYAAAFSPWYIGSAAGLEHLIDTYAAIGTMLDAHNPTPLIAAAATAALLAAVNRKVQYTHIMRELSKTEKARTHKISRFSFLDKYGESGQYMQLEIKTILRNKNPRKSFISATTIVVIISLIISFTDIYDTTFMTDFWCLYNFAIYGCVMLMKIMCHEGNYIDGLMVRRENLLSLLHAKYRFYCALLALPFLLMLPTVISGKWSIWMLLSYAAFTAGFQYFVAFQMTVYNKMTIPLNTKFISKHGMDTNYFQTFAGLLIFLLPMATVSTLRTLFGDTACYAIIFAIGLAFIATNRLWLRNIYNRFMRRRYANMEAFRASR